VNSEESSTVFFFLTGEAAKAVKQDCDDRKRFVVRVDEKFMELESAIRGANVWLGHLMFISKSALNANAL